MSNQRKVKMIDPTEMFEPTFEKKEDLSGYHEITNLPSNFKLYPEGTKLYGRPLNVKEVKRLATMNEDNYNAIIKDILTSCTRGIDVNTILVTDKIYIIFWLRANTYKDAHFTTPYFCEHCERESEYSFDVSDFEITYLPEDFTAADLTKTLMNGDTLGLSYLTVADEDKIKDFKIAMKKGLSQYDDIDIALASMIKTINGNRSGIKTVCEYLNHMDPGAWAQLNSIIAKLDFGVQPVIEAKCRFHNCGEVSPVKVTFRPEFFIPNYNA